MTKTITGEDALALLDKAIELRGPQTIVRTCRYTTVSVAPDGEHLLEPCCIVGTGLAETGVPLEVLERADDSPSGDASIGDDDVLGILEDAGYELADGAVAVLSAAQRCQDKQNSWDLARHDGAIALRRFRGEAV